MSIAELIISIANKVKGIKDNVLAAYDAIASKGGEVPSEKTMENLPTAISSMPLGMYDQLEEVGWTKEQIQDLKDEANLEATKFSITATTMTQEEKDKIIFAKGVDKPTKLLEYLYNCRNVEYIPKIDCSNLARIEHSSCFRNISTSRRMVDVYLYNLNTDFTGNYLRDYAFRTMLYESSKVRSLTMLGNLAFNLTGHTFFGCSGLVSVTLGDCSKIGVFQAFSESGVNSPINITDFSVEKLPDIDMSNAFLRQTKLTHDSLMSIINALPVSTGGYTCTLNATNLAKLTDEEKAIAIDKGWTLN
jgi:hypothetical protein